MYINTSSLCKIRQRTFIFIPFYPILEHQCKFIIHRNHLIIIKVPLRLFFGRFSHTANIFRLGSFRDVVPESLIFCLVTFTVLNPRRQIITAAIFRIPILTGITFFARISEKFPRVPTFQLLWIILKLLEKLILRNTHRKNQVDGAVLDHAAEQRKAPIADSTHECSPLF